MRETNLANFFLDLADVQVLRKVFCRFLKVPSSSIAGMDTPKKKGKRAPIAPQMNSDLAELLRNLDSGPLADRSLEGGPPVGGPTGGRIDDRTPARRKNGPLARPENPRSEPQKGGPAGSRKPTAVRVSLRSSVQRSSFLAVAHRITERDVDIFFDLHRHRVLNTHQLKELHFNSARVATRRLTALAEMGFLERFQPHRATGSNPYHYVLGEAGAFVVASRLGRNFKTFNWEKTDVHQAPFNRFLTHLVEQNSFFTRLAWAYRKSGTGRLAQWNTGYDSTFRWSVVSDGFGTVVEANRTVRFAYEHDRGTESGGQLQDKIDRYLQVANVLEDKERDSTILLFCFHSERREKSARKHLFGSGFPLATGVYDRVMDDPLGRVWLPLMPDDVPVRLIDLGYLSPLWQATEIT